MLSTLKIIKDFIAANIADAITIVETENSITLTPYKVLQVYTPLGMQFPSISINPLGVDEMEEGAGNRSFFGNPSKRDDTITIQVWGRGNKDTANTVEADVVGYMDALEELFKGDYTLTGIKGVEILETTFTELFPDLDLIEQNLLLKGATLRLKVRYNII